MNLKAPSTADFSSRKLLEREGTKYLFQYEVDAENSFGDRLRSTWLVFVEVIPSAPHEYEWKRDIAAQTCSDSPTTEEITSIKTLNAW